MSLSILRSTVERLKREVSDLEKQLGQASKDESSKVRQIGQVQSSLKNTSSLSAVESKLREIARYNDDLARIGTKKSDLGRKIADKTKQLHKAQQDLAKEEEQARKKQEQEQNKLKAAKERQQREQLDRERAITKELQRQKALSIELQANTAPMTTQAEEEYDVFISHASEDKEEFVRPLVQALEGRGFKVWYDEFTLTVGDSLRRSIDKGLANSRYGVVVLSGDFFAKQWTNYELNGLNAKEMTGAKVILPIWHKVSKDEVMKQSPSLADKVALNSSLSSVEEIADQLSDVLKKV